MKICNCGAKMTLEDWGCPKQYSCPQCGASLTVDKNGTQRWYDKDGNPGTYSPLKKEEQ